VLPQRKTYRDPVLGKGLGGGLPLAALVAHQDVCCFDHDDQGGTFNGNAFATAVG
jgi:acetylornithine/N-succinyldiaminopimelate aminotransferase